LSDIGDVSTVEAKLGAIDSILSITPTDAGRLPGAECLPNIVV
jgi:hypothetical protein